MLFVIDMLNYYSQSKRWPAGLEFDICEAHFVGENWTENVITSTET